MKSKFLVFACILASAITGYLVFQFSADIAEKKGEARTYPLQLAKNTDEDPDVAKWGLNFPSQLDGYMAMKDDLLETPYGGSLPFSKIIRWPAAAVFWDGYAFAVDYNKPRTHFFSQIDQMESKRVDIDHMRNDPFHGLKAFKGQPGACLNCHSGFLTTIMKGSKFADFRAEPVEAAKREMPFFDVDTADGAGRKAAWTKMNSTPYFNVIGAVRDRYGEGMHGSHLGSACADCHAPEDMTLRVTRPAFVNAMVARGYEADAKSGLKGNRQQMRDYVCMQCHTEYFFQGKDATLVFPWDDWKKDAAWKMEDFDTYYEKARESGFYPVDYTHRKTGAKIIKMQHPEAELASAGIHARSGVTCVDCHMPYKREGANKVTEHNIQSPYADIQASCKTCHPGESTDALTKRVAFIQDRHAHELRDCEDKLLSYVQDVIDARAMLAATPQFASIEDEKARFEAISEALKETLEFHRKAQMRWDIGFSENSYGFHAPQEAMRILGQCKELARAGQVQLINDLAGFNLTLKLRQTPDAPRVLPQITTHKAPTASLPTPRQKLIDEKSRKLNFL